MKRLAPLLTVLCAAAVLAPLLWSYTHLRTSGGNRFSRGDFDSILFRINDQIAPGMQNNDGQIMITGNSDPVGALREAIATWSDLPHTTIHFQDAPSTSLANANGDGENVIVFRDDPEIRSVVGSALAVALNGFTNQGEILETDILFNPAVIVSGQPRSFSTDGAANTFDIRATAVHELGHALGLNHSMFLGASMFQGGSGDTQAFPSTDDLAGMYALYGTPESAGKYGRLRGRVTTTVGAPVRGAMVVATDPDSGYAAGALTSLTDGTWEIPRLKPGNYVVYAEPLDGPVLPGNLSLNNGQVDAVFTPAFAGGPGAIPTLVTAGATSTADILVNSAPSALTIDFLARGSLGGAGDFSNGSGRLPVNLDAGQALDLLIAGDGIDDSITAANIQLIGAGVEIRPGSVRLDPSLSFSDGSRPLRFTLDVTSPAQRSLVSIVVTRGNDVATHSGALVVLPAQGLIDLEAGSFFNAASAVSGPIAPDSWVTVYAENLAQGLVIGDASLPVSLGGTTVTITDSTGASHFGRLQFVSPGQLNFLVPEGVATGPATIRIRSFFGQGAASVIVNPLTPGIFSANSSGQGPAAATYLTVLASGDRLGDFTFDPGQSPRPNVPISLGAPGDQVYLTLYGTGLRNHSSNVTATVAGFPVPVLGAVAQGEFDGLDQINIGPLPRDLIGRGQVEILFLIDGIETNAVTVALQ